MTLIEEWRPIPWAPRWSVSSEGRVRGPRGLLTLFKRPNGYLACQVSNSQQRVNMLVCHAFHGPRPSLAHHAAHLNSIRDDNRKDNLAWKLPIENSADIPREQRSNQAKLPVEAVLEIRARRNRGETIAAIHRSFPFVCYATVSHICNGRNWTHV